MTVSREAYDELMLDRPTKFESREVDYRPGQAHHRCDECMHYFRRAIDGYATCEIFRPEEDDSVLPEYVCNFFTRDGSSFPLLK